jgi:single-strand DNA-binding protein
MNNLRNSVRLVGRTGMAPETTTFENGSKKIKFSMATTDVYKDASGQKKEDTQWHNVVAWGGLAATMEKYLTKGKEIAIEGKLVHRSYEDSKGQKRYITEIVASEIIFLGDKSKAAS